MIGINETIGNITFIPPTFNSVNVSAQFQACEINQMAMLNQLQKLPKAVIIFIGIALLGCLFHVYVAPLLKGEALARWGGSGVMLALGSLVWAFLFAAVFTFKLSEQQWNNILTICEIVVAVIILLISFIKRKKIKELWNYLTKKEESL